MAKLFYTNIDLKGNQLLNGVIHNATTAPENGVAGQVYYNTNDKLMYQHNGTEWVVVGGSVANLTTDVKKVVTGSTTSNGTANLQTTDLKDMKVGVGLTNLTNVTTETTLSNELQALDTALQDVKTTYVKAGSTYTDGQLLVAGVNGAIETASTTGYSIETTLDASHEKNIPTSAAVANYVGSLAGGINYRGTIGATGATVQTLPTIDVKVGDAYAVTTAGTYTPLSEPSAVGDLIICNSVNGGTITWTNVPINFTVEDKQLRNFAPASGAQTIATIDGKDITMSLQAITTGTSGTGNVITNVSADSNNKLTLTKGNALTTVSSTGTGVVTSVAKNSDNQTIDVTLTDLTTNAPTGIQYVTSVSQASNGKVTVSGTNFDGTVPTSNPSTSNAPTTKAVKDYVDGKIDGLDGSATIASEANSVVTLKAGITETNGVVSNNSGSDIVLAKVAKTGKAEDVETTAITKQGSEEIIVPAGNVQDSLQYIARELDAAVAGSVASFGGETGAITVGNGLKMTDKEVSANVNGYIVNNAGTGNKALDIDSTKVDGNYTVENTTNLATVGTVKTAIEGLDVSNITGFGKGKTLATLTETDGKVAATFQDIEITHTQVSDWSSNIGVQSVTTGTANGTIGVSTNGGAAADVAVKGLQTAAYVNVDYFEKKFTDGSHDVVTIGSYAPASGEIATQKVEFFDGTQTNGALGTSAVTDTLYISKAVTAANPIITNDDLSGITGAMVYKGVVDGTHALPTTNITAGWTYVVAAAGTYAGQACEVGDMIIAKETKASGVTNSDWNVINGENQVSNKGITVQAGAGLQTVAIVDGTDITVGVKVVGGNATIASKSGNVVTIKTGVTQSGTTGTIGNATGTDIVLDDVAVTGAANELTVTNAVYGTGSATDNAQTALTNLASAITNANITIDGHKGAITTGDGITDVAEDGGSFGIQIDSTNANGLSVGTDGLAMAKATGSTFGTVEVTAGNGLTLTNGVVAYAHNTSAITVASKNASTNVITINGTLTPNASDTITASNAITLAAVAATGAANELTVTSGTYGGSTATTNAQTALNNLASSAVLVYKSGALTFSNNTATITISGADLQNSAITEIRDSSHNVVECDVVYTNATTITVTANGNPTGLYAIVHYKKA